MSLGIISILASRTKKKKTTMNAGNYTTPPNQPLVVDNNNNMMRRVPFAPIRPNVVARPVQPQPQQEGIENGPTGNVFADRATQFFIQMVNDIEIEPLPALAGLMGLPDDE